MSITRYSKTIVGFFGNKTPMSYSCPQKIKNGALSFVDDFIEITGKQILFVKSNSTYCFTRIDPQWLKVGH